MDAVIIFFVIVPAFVFVLFGADELAKWLEGGKQ